MSEAPTTGQDLATMPQAPTPAPRAVREYRVVESALGIMDTARFEHLGRVATVLAKAGLLPESLTHEGPKDSRKVLPYETIQARAFLIVNQADLFQMDPNALAQCCSFVHGKLMYEGKLVHALVSAKLGLDLTYEFGLYDPVARDIRGTYQEDEDGPLWVGEMPTKADDQALAVRVSGILPGERRRRQIAGSVGMWHKGPSSPWGNAQAWPRQLRYMGAREWVRAHKPSLLLGILTDDEVDDYEMGRQAGAIAAPAPQMLHSGFSDPRPAELLPPAPQPEPATPAKRTRGKAAQKAAEPLPPHNPDTGEVIEGTATTTPAPAVESQPEPEVTTTQVAEEVDVIAEGFPEVDEIYHLDGDAWTGDGKRDTYKNGKPFSSASRAAGYLIYDDHAGVLGSEEKTAAEQISHVEQAPEPAAEEDEPAPPPLSPEVLAYADAIKAAPDFQTVKATLAAFQKTQTWKDMSNDDADEVRWNTWDIMVRTGLAAKVNPADDVSAFRLWIEWQEDPEMIERTLSKLEEHPDFKAKPDATKENLRGATKARLERLAS